MGDGVEAAAVVVEVVVLEVVLVLCFLVEEVSVEGVGVGEAVVGEEVAMATVGDEVVWVVWVVWVVAGDMETVVGETVAAPPAGLVVIVATVVPEVNPAPTTHCSEARLTLRYCPLFPSPFPRVASWGIGVAARFALDS